jgi:hypothetical protein
MPRSHLRRLTTTLGLTKKRRTTKIQLEAEVASGVPRYR